MDFNTLLGLEEKYWAGETSLEEERILKSAALEKHPGLSDELKALLGSTAKAADLELDADFDASFWDRVEAPVARKPFILQFANVLKYAAAVLVLLGITAVVWNLIDRSETEQSNTSTEISAADTYEDPEIAFEQAKKALALASEKFNKGAEPMGEIKRFHSAQMSITGNSNHSDKDN